jgi:hypothetical protein
LERLYRSRMLIYEGYDPGHGVDNDIRRWLLTTHAIDEQKEIGPNIMNVAKEVLDQ